MRRVAIYDLDKTLTRRPTFTPFLVFAARRLAPWRLVLVPLWIAAMGGYKVGLYSRTALKTFGMRLMTGRADEAGLVSIGNVFAKRFLRTSGTMPRVMRLLEEDRETGAKVLIATAAFRFYANAFARELGIADVIATEWDGRRIPGGNCYGAEKHRRVLTWLARECGGRGEVHLRFASDSFADSPLLDEADEAIFVSNRRKKRDEATRRGWSAISGLN